MKRITSLLINLYKKYGYIFQGKVFSMVILFYKENRVSDSILTSLRNVLIHFKDIKVYKSFNGNSIHKLFKGVVFDDDKCAAFVYSLDVYKSLRTHAKVLNNCTIDYSKALESGLESFRIKDAADDFSYSNNRLLDDILMYLERLKAFVIDSSISNKKNICTYIERFRDMPAENLEEAMQRILILNQIQWQTGHILVGLGRLDKYLDRFDEDENKAEILFEEFFTLIHKYYTFKSNALMGDTGQIVIVGGYDENGDSKEYRYTELIARVIKRLKLPDPKLLFRVNRNTGEEMWRFITEYISEGNGSPLISNDDVIIGKMIEFGYESKDANDYITSACWEPIAANCYEQNNILSLNFLYPFDIISKDYNLSDIGSYDRLFEIYLTELQNYAESIALYLSQIKWEKDPLYSMFDSQAIKTHKDITLGGSKYNDYGILTVALGNTVKAFSNLKKYVFEEKRYTYAQFDKMRKKNFKGYETELKLLRESSSRWGHDEKEVCEFANRITECAVKALNKNSDKFGHRIKIGLSSPHYIMDSEQYEASFDGRKKGDPFMVHISSSEPVAYTEIMNFGAMLDYSKGRFNGNTLDMMISPGLIRRNVESFMRLFKTAMEQGVFQFQANVIDSETLQKAKNDPNLFPNLIVRVWGFNAYFNELPDEYKDYLIERAKQSEFAIN